MSRQETFHCDVCKAKRGEANHWFLLNPHALSIVIGAWEEEDARQEGIIHLCGEACVLKRVGEFLAKQ